MNPVCLLGGTCLIFLIMKFDIIERRIPNSLSAGLAAVAVANAMLMSSYPGVKESIIVFIVGALLFLGGVLGGGDVKMMTASALMLPGQLAELCLITALAGGALALFALGRSVFTRRFPHSLPYGVAIGSGTLFCLWA